MPDYFESPELVAAETLRDQTAGQEWEAAQRDWDAETGFDEEPDTEWEIEP